ncbi:MAG: type II toxin-antitoxin system HipA family toxin [Deltaproteobacteria bacterium]|nr:type II toxin-antitoxin system HipA family toxin [Deltaproteobacteria bacterium]
MSKELEILLYGEPVATLTKDAHGQWALRFTPSYLQLDDRPVLGQKFEDALHSPFRGKKGNLPPFFANLVPEGELRPILEDTLAIVQGDDVALLEVIGRDLPGAVEFRTISAGEPERHAIEDDAVEPTAPRDHDSESMRFSLAGVQLKFSVILANDKITLPAHGKLGDWLVKLDSRRFPRLSQNEHSIMAWARHAGFDVPECQILPSSALIGKLGDYAEPDTFVLAVRRYDRHEGQKIHQEDYAQAVNLYPVNKYDHVSYEQLTVLTEKFVGEGARDEVIRRLVFMIASGNGDAHLKNWSLIYPDRIHAQLSPLYDQVSTVAWPELDRNLALNFAGTKDMSQLDRQRVERFAGRAQLDGETVLKFVDATLAQLANAWKSVTRSADWVMAPEHVDALRDHWQRTPLLRDSPLAGL